MEMSRDAGSIPAASTTERLANNRKPFSFGTAPKTVRGTEFLPFYDQCSESFIRALGTAFSNVNRLSRGMARYVRLAQVRLVKVQPHGALGGFAAERPEEGRPNEEVEKRAAE
jgi:hypothetical protein